MESSKNYLSKMLHAIQNKRNQRNYLQNLNVCGFAFDLSDLLEMKIRDEELARYFVQKSSLLIYEDGYPRPSTISNEICSFYFQKAFIEFVFIKCFKCTLCCIVIFLIYVRLISQRKDTNQLKQRIFRAAFDGRI